MNKAQMYRVARLECEKLLRLGIIDLSTFEKVAELYPVTKWDFRSLGKWFLFFGAMSSIAGLVTLFALNWGFTLENLGIGLSLLFFALLLIAQRLKQRGLVMTANVIELIASFDAVGLSILAIWLRYGPLAETIFVPVFFKSVVLYDLIFVILLGYLLLNKLILVFAANLFFVWFGGFTGYVSGFGAYYFGMNYPLRFFIASMAIVAMAFAHLKAEQKMLERYRGFFKVWLSTGLFFGEMSLWLLSIFGNFNLESNDYFDGGGKGDLVLFNGLWLGINAALFMFGTKNSIRMMVGYAVTFLIIQLYTLFFTYVAGSMPPLLVFLGTGLSLLYVVKQLELLRKKTK